MTAGGRRPNHLAPRYDRRRLVALLLAAAVIVAAVIAAERVVLREDDSADPDPDPEPALDGRDAPPDAEGDDAGEAAGEDEAVADDTGSTGSGFERPGLLTFRGGPSRSYYGEGPVPDDPDVLWRYPADGAGMCTESRASGELQLWCGTGWTGQPAVFERDGRTWVTFGAYDRHVHFLDFETGEQLLPSYETGDLIKGSVSIDPDGFPLLYVGGAGADNELHVVALDGERPEKLWSLDANAVSPTMWNDDWDGSPLILDDFLFQGGENSVFHVVKLNRDFAEDGTVRVAPELVFDTPGWDQELLDGLVGSARSPQNVSIENSVAYHDGVAYFSNGGGLVQGWDVSQLDEGVEPTQVFRFWAGDDTDATITIDDEGFLYVAVEFEHALPRGEEVGQVVKLDPDTPDDPVVWSFHDPSSAVPRGLWATVGLHDDLVIAPTTSGRIFGLDRMTGEVRWDVDRGHQTWSSPVIVDDVWIQASCDETLRAYDVSDTTVQPPELWSVELEGCIESTPAVWDGRVFVGARSGGFYAIG